MGLEPLQEPKDPLFGGLTVEAWFQLFTDTHCVNGMGGFVRVEWPEPGGLADQPAVVPFAFQIVQTELMEASRRNAK